MRVSLLSGTDLIVPGTFLLAAVMGLIAAAIQQKLGPLLATLIFGAPGVLWLRYLKKHHPELVLEPEGFTILDQGPPIQIRWDDLCGLNQSYRGGRYRPVWLTITAWNAERTEIVERKVALGLIQADDVETLLKRYWKHPERRDSLSHATQENKRHEVR